MLVCMAASMSIHVLELGFNFVAQYLGLKAPYVPGPRRQLAKGEARSKLNELCMKQRWKDPEYKRVSIGGVTHAPV